VEYMEQPNNVRLKFNDIHLVDFLLNEDQVKSIIDDIDKYGQENSKLVADLKEEILGSVNGKYAEKNSVKFSIYKEGMILPKVSFIINLKGELLVDLLINDRTYVLGAGSFLMFPTNFKFRINKKDNDYFVIGNATYSNNKEGLLDGKNKYTVISSILDEYELDVFAENESDAIAKASFVDISQWNHLDLYPDLDDKVVTKFSKWGNFRIKQ